MRYVLWSILILGLVSGCVLLNSGGSFTKVPVYLTDNPAFDLQALWVKVSDVEYHYSLNDEGYTATATLFNDEFDLLSLAGTETQFFEMELPEGAMLQWIKINLQSSATAVTSSGTISVRIPSEKIKIVKPVIVQNGSEIVLDFDVARSLKIVQTGNNSEYILRPVIVPYHRERHEYEQEEEHRYRYEVEGRVALEGENMYLVALFEGNTPAGTLVDLEITDDEFGFEDLKEATYTIYVYDNFDNIFSEETSESSETGEEEMEIDEDYLEGVNQEIALELQSLTPQASEVFYLHDATITTYWNSNYITLELDD
ncbi:DUF4382 domain-containing protein [Thermotoga sp. KOL6]|uniref:DUF4382 domain-containing protein n=1 Tax=Thermotoga sp. KOL6 TaxID=126741 RepID=UPI000C77BCB8|nr:DUF4382 domain-containing protein [Thermotoga sp. KOL6]PLV60432.1 hypothetical protein AS005_03930 [Thermotoga sp. KOL6]